MTDLVAEYLDHEKKTKELTMQMREHFSKLTMDEKVEWAVKHPLPFLAEDPWFCPHIFLANGREVSLYDDLYWERHETNDIGELVDRAQEEWEGWDDDLAEEDNLGAFTEALKTMDTPVAVVIRHMLENNIGQGTFDW